MGSCRLIYDNLISSADMITVSSQRAGIVTSALKEGQGSASLNPSGSFTGDQDVEYIVEIDSVTAGKEVGQATFKWSDGGGSWDATGVTTSSTPTLLNNGVYVSFSSGAGDDFEEGDRWYFKGINYFGKGKMIDLNRDTRYRSSELESPNTITIDLGSAQEVKAVIIYDHNLTSGATITVKANATDSWATPAFSENIAYNASKIIHYLSTPQTYQYWRIEITDTDNTDGYIEIGELFLSSYLQLSNNFAYGFSRYPAPIYLENKAPYGTVRRRFFNLQNVFEYVFNGLTDTDITNLESLISSITNKANGTILPIFFNEDSDSPNDTWLVRVEAFPRSNVYQDVNTVSLKMEEVVKSV